MNRLALLRQMGVPVWRLRQHSPRQAEAMEAGPDHAETTAPAAMATTEAVPRAEPEQHAPCLRVDLAHGAPGQQLVDELLQAVRLAGYALEVDYCPHGPKGMRLGEKTLPSVGRLLAEPALKAQLWQELMQWLENHDSGEAGTGR